MLKTACDLFVEAFLTSQTAIEYWTWLCWLAASFINLYFSVAVGVCDAMHWRRNDLGWGNLVIATVPTFAVAYGAAQQNGLGVATLSLLPAIVANTVFMVVFCKFGDNYFSEDAPTPFKWGIADLLFVMSMAGILCALAMWAWDHHFADAKEERFLIPVFLLAPLCALPHLQIAAWTTRQASLTRVSFFGVAVGAVDDSGQSICLPRRYVWFGFAAHVTGVVLWFVWLRVYMYCMRPVGLGVLEVILTCFFLAIGFLGLCFILGAICSLKRLWNSVVSVFRDRKVP